MTTRIWFHGTDRSGSQAISEHGFCAGTYFAERLEDALEFGGNYVFMVALDYEPVWPGNWQMRVGDAVPIGAIVRLTQYRCTILCDFPERRELGLQENVTHSD